MACGELSYDNRETCTQHVPSSCIPYTGHIADSVELELPPCKPNINDIIKALQKLIDDITASLGDNTDLNKACLDFVPATVKQFELNQLFIDQLCDIKTQLTSLGGSVNVATLTLAINLLCLTEPGCPPPATYTVQQVFEKLITAYCNLLTRVNNIENYLNL